jgi:hypothetical protein
MERYRSGARSSVKKFDGKNYKAWAFNMQLPLSRVRGMSIVNRTEIAPAYLRNSTRTANLSWERVALELR